MAMIITSLSSFPPHSILYLQSCHRLPPSPSPSVIGASQSFKATDRQRLGAYPPAPHPLLNTMADRVVQLAFPSPPASNSSSTSSLPLHKKYMSMSCPPILNPVQLSDSQRRERWKAGLTLFGSFFTLLVSFGLLNSFGTFEHYYRGNQLQHIPQHNISWIGSLQLWVFSFAVCLRFVLSSPNCSLARLRREVQ